MPLDLAMCLTGALKIQLSCSSQTHAKSHLHGRLQEWGWRKHAFLYMLIAYHIWVCVGVGIVNIGVNGIFSVIQLTAGSNPYLEITGLRKTICCFANVDQYTPLLSWGTTRNISMRPCKCSIFLCIKYRDKFNFYQTDIVITCISFMPSNLTQDWDSSRCWFSVYSLYFNKCLLKQGYALKNVSRVGKLFCVNSDERKINW